MQRIDISTSTMLRFLLILLALGFIFFIRDILVLLFMVLIVVAALSPTVDRWSKFLTRPGAVISILAAVLLVLALVFSLVIPPFITQLQDFGTNLPTYIDFFSEQNATPGFLQTAVQSLRDNLSALSSQLGNVGSFLLTKTAGVISGVVAVITFFVLTFYLLVEEEGLKKIYKGLLPDEWYEPLSEITRKIAVKLGAWLRGQLILMLSVGLLVFVGLKIIGLPYALTLAVWSGLTEVIPIIGPWVGAVPGVILGLAHSPLTGLLALIVYVVVQQLENAFLVPRIMSRAVGLNPLIVILAILIGDRLYGILGVLLAVPMAAVISVIVQDWAVIRQAVRQNPK